MSDSSFTPEQEAYLDHYLATMSEGLDRETDELIRYCKFKSKFAAHYRQKQKKFEETNATMQRRAEQGQVGPGITPAVVAEMIRRGTSLHEARMRRLATHFRETWGGDIGGYVATGGGSGCVVLLAVVLVSGAIVWRLAG